LGELIDFPKECRLLKPSDFSYFKSQSGAFRSVFFLALYKSSREDLPFSRLGLSVTKKFGKAHRRNRAKRVLRECFRSSMLRKFPIDILFILNKKNDQLSENDVDQAIRSEFERFVNFLSKKQI
jgi:ribonuclease P protein component